MTHLSTRFEEALIYAVHVHDGQLRKSTTIPYVSHLMGAASLALEHGGDEDEAIAALLHDAVEDQGGLPRLDAIRNRFGDRVADIVDGCSDAHTSPKPPWRKRKEDYLAHLTEASYSIRLVSGSDKLHNARAILADLREHGDDVWRRFNAKKPDQIWYYTSLVAAFDNGGPESIARELRHTVGEIVRLAGVGAEE